MISLSRLISGIFFVVVSLGLFVAAFFTSIVFLIYAFVLLFLGIWLLANRNEDKIEQRKDIKVRENK